MSTTPSKPSPHASRLHAFLLISATVYLVWSGVHPNGRFNWLMECLPAIVGGVLLCVTRRRFRWTTVSHILVWFFSLILITGGHYTYAEVPIGNWVRDLFGFTRNHFDRFGHFFQGVIPAMLARELFIRNRIVKRGFWLFVLCVSFAVAISAMYELFEWQYATIFGGAKADDFLGSQGDPWDAQKDMLMALLGSIASLIALSRVQDRLIESITGAPIDLP